MCQAGICLGMTDLGHGWELTCIANLSNDEVFTPPEFANLMLDTLAEAYIFSHG